MGRIVIMTDDDASFPWSIFFGVVVAVWLLLQLGIVLAVRRRNVLRILHDGAAKDE